MDISYATILVQGVEVMLYRKKMVEDQNIEDRYKTKEDHANFFNTNIDHFMGYYSDDDHSLDILPSNPVISICGTSYLWMLYFDGGCSREGLGVGIALVSPDGEQLGMSFRPNFQCTNNIVEYKALLLGLNIAHNHKIKCLKIYGDSKLVV